MYVAAVIVLDGQPVIRIRSVTARAKFLVGYSPASTRSMTRGGRSTSRPPSSWAQCSPPSSSTPTASPKGFGLLLAVAILVDALIVRMTMVPSLLTLLKERSWYIPRWLDRLLPNITIEPPHEGQRGAVGVEEPAQATAQP